MEITKDFKTKSVYVSICTIRNAEWPCAIAMYQALEYAASMGQPTRLGFRIGESLICRARQNALHDFITKTTSDYLFTLDDDIEVPAHAIVKLSKADKPIIGGFYRIKDKMRGHAAVRHLSGGTSLRAIMAHELIKPVKYVSGGCMMIRRDVIEHMIEAYPQQHYIANEKNEPRWALYQPYIFGQEYLSEDWAFCQRARDLGYEIWADGSIRCGHYGVTLFDFELEDVDRNEIAPDETEPGPDILKESPALQTKEGDQTQAEQKINDLMKRPAYLEEKPNVTTKGS